MFSWLWPWAGLLLPLPWLFRRLCPPADNRRAGLRVPFFPALLELSSQPSARPVTPLIVLAAWSMWSLLLLAVARPVWFGEPVAIPTAARDLLIAVDLSDSMRIEDMVLNGRPATRMAVIKQVAGDFIERRDGDRIGLIVFGQRSYLQTPLTFDRTSVATQLREALPGFAGSSTAIGDAIGQAIVQLRDRPVDSRVLVLLTDGSNTFGSDPIQASAIAQEAAIRIHTVGIGARSMQVTDPGGAIKQIDPSRDLDEVTLQRVADATGGQYFRARNPQQMVTIYAAIDQLEPVSEPRYHTPQYSLYHWPLALALVPAALLLGRGRIFR